MGKMFATHQYVKKYKKKDLIVLKQTLTEKWVEGSNTDYAEKKIMNCSTVAGISCASVYASHSAESSAGSLHPPNSGGECL